MRRDEWLNSCDPGAMLDFLSGRPGATYHGPGGLPSVCRFSERQSRLFACACCRVVWPEITDPRGREAVEVAERYADGLASDEELNNAEIAADAVVAEVAAGPAYMPVRAATFPLGNIVLLNLLGNGTYHRSEKEAAILKASWAVLLREIAGDPWFPAELPLGKAPCPDCPRGAPDEDCDDCGGSGTVDAPCPWRTPTVTALAHAAYDFRQDNGAVSSVRLSILADALEEAGCEGGRCHQCDGSGHRRVLRVTKSCVFCGGNGRRPHPLLAHLREPGPHYRGCHVLDAILNKE